MKGKTAKIAIFSFLIGNIILQLIYQFVIRTKIPYRWHDIYGAVHNPQEIADHLADCFFLLNYFLLGYVIFSEKHYYDGLVESKMAKIWGYCAQLCQIGGLAAYIILWLGLTDYSFLGPADKADDYVFSLLRGRLSEEQWSYWFDYGVSHEYCIYAAIIFVPVFFFFVLYLGQFFKMYILRAYAECPDKAWIKWNVIYILVFLLVFCWTFESLRGFDLMDKIPGFTQFRLEYYRKHRPLEWYQWNQWYS